MSGDAVRLNRAAGAALQVRRAEVTTVGQWFTQVSGARAEADRHAYAQARAGGHTWSPEPFVVAGDTGPRQIELASYRFDGVCEVWVLHDVTPRREAEERAARSQQEFEAVVNTAVDAIITIDEDGEIQSFNQAATRMFGYDADEAVGQNVRILMPEPHASRHDAYIKRYLDTGEARIIGRGREVLARRRDGTTFPADLAVSEINHSRRFTGVLRDLTSRRDLERRLVDSQYATRRTLARELHDGMGGTMAGIGMLAATLSAQLRKTGSPLAERADELIGAIDQANQQLRGVTEGLLPVADVPEGLMDSLQRLVDQCETAHGLESRFECEVPIQLDDPTIASQLYRIAQEAVTNVVRHAQAQHLTVTLGEEHGLLRLEVSDDGVGFQEIPDGHRGLGLVSMQQRCAQLGGQWSVAPGQDGGTRVTCVIPLSRSDTTPNRSDGA